VGAAQVAEPQDTVEAQPSDKVVGGGRVPVTDMAAATSAATQAATGGGSPAPEVLLGGATNVTTKEVAADDLASSARPSGGASSSTEAADNSGVMELEVILGHPTLRAPPRDVSLDEAMGMFYWVLT
jgi:hypothetical protein